MHAVLVDLFYLELLEAGFHLVKYDSFLLKLQLCKKFLLLVLSYLQVTEDITLL
jgi:hypothetical protein